MPQEGLYISAGYKLACSQEGVIMICSVITFKDFLFACSGDRLLQHPWCLSLCALVRAVAVSRVCVRAAMLMAL